MWYLIYMIVIVIVITLWRVWLNWGSKISLRETYRRIFSDTTSTDKEVDSIVARYRRDGSLPMTADQADAILKKHGG